MSYKSILAVAGIAAMFAVGVFAQRVGDTVPVNGQNYRIQSINGDDILLRKVKKYEVVNQSLSWTDAKREAERRGGYLAVITSAEEQKTIEALVTSNGSMNLYWIGGQCESDRVWKWVTGERMNYTNWGPGENNNSGVNDIRMSFTRQPFTFQGNSINLGQWADVPNGRSYGYIIEWD
jgi:hypothetical protein